MILKNAYAQCVNFVDCLKDIETPGLNKDYTPNNLITKLLSDIFPIILGLAGFGAVIIIIISGIQFILSSGNPESAAAARGRLIFALIGFAIIALAFAILQIIDNIFLKSGVV